MRRALGNAERGWGQTAPNPMVGAVVVSGDLGFDGWHHRFGEAHAEVVALRAAGDRAKGSTMYVTLEPCAHHGKTPPCADAIIAAGVARVVIATRDPNPEAAGGIERLRAAGIAVEVGVERAPACELNAAFFNAFVSDRPWVTLKLAVSTDWAICGPGGRPRWITGDRSRREAHRMRAGVDAVAVGIGTVLADDPLLTVRDVPAPRVAPARVIFDSRCRTPLDSALVRTAFDTPTIVVARKPPSDAAKALTERGLAVIDEATLAEALVTLRRLGIRSLLVEGGAALAGSLIRDRLVDRIAIFQAPISLGPRALGAFAKAPAGTREWLDTLPVVDRRTFGDDTLISYAVREAPCSPV